jgi:hypothetical protein
MTRLLVCSFTAYNNFYLNLQKLELRLRAILIMKPIFGFPAPAALESQKLVF